MDKCCSESVAPYLAADNVLAAGTIGAALGYYWLRLESRGRGCAIGRLATADGTHYLYASETFAALHSCLSIY